MADAPLAGLRVVVTRPPAQAAPLVGALERLGASAVAVPLVETAPVDDPAALDAAAERLADYDWVVFTSANGVRAFGDRLRAATTTPRVAVVGPATAEALRTLGVEPVVVGSGTGEDLAGELRATAGERVLLVQGDLAGPEVAAALRGHGAAVDVVTAYRTLARAPGPEELETLRGAEVVVLASGSAARSLAASGGAGDAALVCIGPRTAGVAREVGLSVGLVAGEATAEGIIRALVEHYGEST